MQPETAIFGCRGIGISFGGRAILQDVSLSVAPGEVLGLVGPNGAGKTSLFEILCGRYTASGGEVFLKGQDITRMAVHDRARAGLARTYQSPVVPGALTIAKTFRAARLAYAPFKTRMDAEWACHMTNCRQPWDRLAGSLDTFDRRKLLLSCLLMRDPVVQLLEATSETCHFSRFNGSSMTVIATAEGRKVNRITMQGIEFLPVCTTAAGRAFLAFAPPETAAALMDAEPLSAPDRAALGQALQHIRKAGYATVDHFEDEDIVGIARPVLRADQSFLGALAVIVPPNRMTEGVLQHFLAALQASGAEISKGLGGYASSPLPDPALTR